MTEDTQSLIKIIAGTALIIALVINLLERIYTPNYIVTEDSKELPNWIGWFGWVLAATATVVYVVVDFVDWSK